MEEITLITHAHAKSPVSEAYRTIRTNIQFSQIAGKRLKSIIITSSLPGEGKSTTISNLAVTIAQTGKNVVVVDCDMRNPTQHKILHLENKGLSNCIATGDSIDSIIQGTTVPNLWLVASGPVPPNPSELLGSEKMMEFLENMNSRFDYVLVDAPPIIPVTDAAVLASKVDGVIMILASGAVAPAAAKEAKTRLEQAGAHIMGLVLNKVDIGHHYGYGHGYGHGYGYGYGYDSYYEDKKQDDKEKPQE